jgi:hypothetical protein
LRIRSILTLATVMTVMSVGSAQAAWGPPRVLDGKGGADGRVVGAVRSDTAAVRYASSTHVFYGVSIDGHLVLRHGQLGASQTFETLDGAGGVAGRTTHEVGSDVAVATFDGALHVFYRDDTAGDLRHGVWNGSAWAFETLDGASTIGGRIVSDLGQRSVATTYNGALELFYLDPPSEDVRRATFDGLAWTFSTLDGDATAHGHTSHAVGYNLQLGTWGGALHVLYFEQDPAYGELLGWVRDARLRTTRWRYSQAFRVNTVVPGKTLTVGAVARDDVFVA